MAKQEDQSDTNSVETRGSVSIPGFGPLIFSRLAGEAAMIEVRCPRCKRLMHWNGRLKIFICDTDGFILGPNDPYVKRLEYETTPGPRESSGH